MNKRKKLNRFNRSNPIPAKLGEADQYHLDQFRRKLDLIRDRTRGVAERYQNGVYIVGRPGSSKTRTVTEELDKLKTPYTYRNSRMTSLGLWSLLEEHPEHTLVLDDIPSLVTEKTAQQILMAALGGDPGAPRTVTYTTKEVDGRRSIKFRGGIIALSNVALQRDPLADAIASRIPILEHEPTDEMIAAFMRYLTLHGVGGLTPDEGHDVVDFVISESRSCDYRLDLRTLIKGCGDYRFWKDGRSHTDWRDLVRSSMKQIVAGAVKPLSQDERLAEERKIVGELFAKFTKRSEKKARDKAWAEKTGKSVDTLYRHKRWLDGLVKG